MSRSTNKHLLCRKVNGNSCHFLSITLIQEWICFFMSSSHRKRGRKTCHPYILEQQCCFVVVLHASFSNKKTPRTPKLFTVINTFFVSHIFSLCFLVCPCSVHFLFVILFEIVLVFLQPGTVVSVIESDL